MYQHFSLNERGYEFQAQPDKYLNISTFILAETFQFHLFKHLIISMKKMKIDIEERLLWKLVQFAGFGQDDVSDESLDENDYDTKQ